MIKAFIINLDRSKDRRTFMTNQLNSLGIDYEFISGTDGLQLSKKDIENLYDKKVSLKYITAPLMTNEVAAAHSHVKAYKEILRQNLDYALILEDDTVLDRKIVKVLKREYLEKYSFDWLQLSYSDVGFKYFRSWLNTTQKRIIENPLFFLIATIKAPYVMAFCLYEGLRNKRHGTSLTVGSFARPLYLSSAYIVTPAGIQKMLPLCDPILFASDMLPNKARWMSNLKMRAIIPNLGSQDQKNFPSITRS